MCRFHLLETPPTHPQNATYTSFKRRVHDIETPPITGTDLMLDHAGFHKLPKGLQITVGDVYDFVSDVNAVVTVHFLNFVNSNDVGAMNTQETFFWQHVFYSLHRQMGDKRLRLIVKIKQHIVFHAVYIDNIIDSQVPPLAIDPDEDRAWLLSLKGWRLWGSILCSLSLSPIILVNNLFSDFVFVFLTMQRYYESKDVSKSLSTFGHLCFDV